MASDKILNINAILSSRYENLFERINYFLKRTVLVSQIIIKVFVT